MFNPANLANEVFGILRSFDYVVNIFDFDGNRVYEPDDARRFFASPKNITVSIHEDGENSSIKMFLSKSIEISEVSGLISTMRSTASKFGLLFNVRKYERELKPKDLAPNGSSDFDAGVSLSTAESGNTSAENSPELNFKKKSKEHSPKGEKLDRITGEISHLTKDFKEIVGLLHNKKVKESMTISNKSLNEAEGQTINILGTDVEADAWENFKKDKLPMASKPNLNISDNDVQNYITSYETKHDGISFDHDTAVKAIQLSRVADSIKDTAPKLAAAFRIALAQYVTGSAGKVIDSVVKKAIAAGSYGMDDSVPDHDGSTPEKRDTISVREFDGKVERQAWQDFVNDYIDFSAPVDFARVKLGASANKMASYLNLVAEKTKSAGLANMFSQFATDIEDGRSTPLKVKVAKHAIEIAQHGKVEVGESLIVTESIREFGNWFDSLSINSLFESNFDDSPYSDIHDASFDLAYKTSRDNFSPEAFLDDVGSKDFNYGDDSLSEEDKTVEYDYVKSSLVHYLQQGMSGSLGDDYPENDDADKMADEFMPAVLDVMTDAGWNVIIANENNDEAIVEATIDWNAPLELLDGTPVSIVNDYGTLDRDSDQIVVKTPDGKEHYVHHSKVRNTVTKNDIAECDDELSTEDVLLPTRPDNDFTQEVTTHEDTEDMDRIVALARGNSATYSPNTPKV